VQEILYAVVPSGFTVAVPDTAPFVEKLVPEHEVVLADDHVSVEAPPEPTLVGLAERLAVGLGAGFTVSVLVSAPFPPLPVHVTV
jgi:hypothetical protein